MAKTLLTSLFIILCFSFLPFLPDNIMNYFDVFLIFFGHVRFFKIIYNTHMSNLNIISIVILIVSQCFSIPIPLQLPQPTYQQFFQPLTLYTTQSDKILSIQFPQINYQISSSLYFQDGGLTDEEIFQPQSYTLEPDQYCQLYHTSLDVIERAALEFGWQADIVKYLVVHEDAKSRIYILSADSILHLYIFDKITIKSQQQYNLSSEISQKISLTNIEMAYLNKTLLIFTPTDVHIVYEGNIVSHFGLVEGFGGVDKIVGAGVVEGGQYAVWVCAGRSLWVYSVYFGENGSEKKVSFAKKQAYENVTTTSDISAITYDPQQQQFYLVSAQQLIILPRTSTPPSTSITYTINGNCNRITKLNQTLYLICQYEKISFIAEILITNGNGSNSDGNRTVALNRYYDGSMVEGIREISTLGYDKMALIGDQIMLIIGQAVNRNTLLQLEANTDSEQLYQVINSFGMVSFQYLKYYSTQVQSTLLLINSNSLKIVSIIYESPQLQCILSRDHLSPSVTILVAFNTTHCPGSNSGVIQQFQQIEAKSNMLLTCQIYYPMQVNIATKQYEQKAAYFILFVIMVVLGASIIVCMACGIKIRNNANYVMQKIRKQIEKAQKMGKKKKQINKI